ncbi:hypothetical protein W97_08997 [Coniosporium apollinis CBS 100218]|uniref:Uncharacterized protein n=1 Tax=Coniosporium apollinis (strain CBS 100218) TaxID=1168221 RepID=R7Z6C1_CONA1|nr:uncharacterized protein W97_08997 [Coniosporium apollinis CBS 100218]EON69735.1 hypothetical protein W97_08997 [Coniosporium apollinis CBS 100218]
MAPQFPSIEQFFEKQSSQSPKKRARSSSPSQGRDGFTEAEVDAVLHPPANQTWSPPNEYEEIDIAALIPGPKCVTFVGRVANFYDQGTPSKKPRAAKGCVKIIVKDDTGALTVRLWYANKDYNLRLGHLVTVWTPHISHSDTGQLAPSSAPLFASIFPERDRSCHFMVHENSDEGVQCKTPLGYKVGQPLAGLMTLKNFIEGGYEITDGKILVCVKSIGPRKKFTTKKGIPAENVNIGVFDDTAEASLTLWGSSAASAGAWKVSHTILLITEPGWRIDKRAWISLTSSTQVDVNPAILDTEWLRGFAQRLTRREHVNPPFPEGVFDTEAAEESQVRILYTLADIDEFARTAPGGKSSFGHQKFMGYLSVIIMELNITSLHRRNMLMCTECCGVPLYANATSAKCKQCDKEIILRINPRLLGPLIDETGTTSTGKLILSAAAWKQLLGRTAQELVASAADILKYLEQRLLFVRVTLLFGWIAEEGEGVGRLCIWGVRM